MLSGFDTTIRCILKHRCRGERVRSNFRLPDKEWPSKLPYDGLVAEPKTRPGRTREPRSAPAPAVVPHPLTNVYVIKQLELALRPRLIDACSRAGLTSPQYTALTVLRRRPAITSSELARRSLVRPQTMATTIEALLDRGLVTRENDVSHARRMLLYLTDSGSRVIDEVAPLVQELENLVIADLSPEESEQFADYLRRARQSISASHRLPPVPPANG
jgi:DNA-binding MarR family transcriptional regulator